MHNNKSSASEPPTLIHCNAGDEANFKIIFSLHKSDAQGSVSIATFRGTIETICPCDVQFNAHDRKSDQDPTTVQNLSCAITANKNFF
jgi:hypothetical protein